MFEIYYYLFDNLYVSIIVLIFLLLIESGIIYMDRALHCESKFITRVLVLSWHVFHGNKECPSGN